MFQPVFLQDSGLRKREPLLQVCFLYFSPTTSVLKSYSINSFPGVATCGSGVGAFVLAPLIRYLENNNGWRGVNIILAGFCFQCAVFGATMRPLKKEPPKIDSSVLAEDNKISVRKSMRNLLKDKAFVLLMLANPPAVMGHYLIFVFLPGVKVLII